VVRQLAQAVQHAHANNIVHRDLKPANVLVAEDGTLKVADFGMARHTDAGGDTRTSAAMGTPAYMAPEQWSDARRAGPAADVWALGVILYECLSGQVPFGRDFSAATMERARNDDPPALGPDVPRDLEVICRKCLAKEPPGRFASAEGLAEELRRFLEGEPLTVRPVGRVERAVKWVRRHPVPAASAAAVVLALVAGAAVATALGLDAREQARLARLAEGRERDRADGEQKAKEAAEAANVLASEREREADAARLEAEAGREAARTEAGNARRAEADAKKQLERVEAARYAITLDLAQRAWEQNDLNRMADLLDDTNAAVRGWEYGHLRDLERRAAVPLLGHSSRVRSVVFSPDGRQLATASDDGTARVWNANTGHELRAFKAHPGGAETVAFSPDGKRIATAGSDGSARVWDAASGEGLLTLKGHEGPVHCVAFALDGKQLVTAGFDRTARIWDATTGQETRAFKGHTSAVFAVAFASDGKRIVSASDDKTARVRDVATPIQDPPVAD
jgi:hypothetical protein